MVNQNLRRDLLSYQNLYLHRQYINLDSVSTASLTRPATGMLVLNHQHDVTITTVPISTSACSVYIELYIYRAMSSNLFCIPITIPFDGPYPYVPRFCVYYTQTADFKAYCILFDGNEIHQGIGTLTGSKLSGWHAFKFSVTHGVGVYNLYRFYFNATAGPNGEFMAATFEPTWAAPDLRHMQPLLGQVKSTVGSTPFTGMINRLSICDTVSFCGNSDTLTRDTLIDNSAKLYQYYWPLNDEYNSYEEYKVISYEKIQKDIGSADFIFYNADNTRVVYPTNNGWVSLYRDSLMMTEPFPFNSAMQFTIEFEFLKFEHNTVFWMYPWFDENNQFEQYWTNYHHKIQAGSKDTIIPMPSLDAAKWTKVMYSYTYDEDNGKITLSMDHQILRDQADNSAKTCSLDPATIDGAGAKALASVSTTTNTMSIRIKGLQGIFRNLKYYPWAINTDTCEHYEPYEETGNAGYDYQPELYLQKFFSETATISNSTNPCLTYFTDQPELCMDLTEEKHEYCSEGFREEYFHCIDQCGDGVVQLAPRMLECDDGNLDNGDGCSKQCTVEDKYVCVVDKTMGDRSYCQLICGNGILDTDTEVCDDGNYGSGDGCESNCTVTSKHICEQIPGQPSYCTPICGNSEVNPDNDETCDDGNNLDFDGCSKDCIIEPNYICIQEVGKADKCITEFTRPAIVSDKFDQMTNTITIEFDQEMMNQEINDTSVLLFIESPTTEIYFTLETKFEGKKFIATFTPSPPLIGGIGEIITLTLQEVEMFKSNNSIPMLSAVAFTYAVPAFPVSGSAESSGKGASYTFLFTIGISLGVGMLTGGSSETMWSLANTLQILFFMGLIELDYPSDLENTFKIMAYSNFETPFTKYVTSVVFFGMNFIKSPVSPKFESLGFESTNILVNSFDKIGMICLFIFLALILSFLYKCIHKSESRTARCIKKIDKSIRYESFTRFVVELILNLSVACWINIWYGSVSNTEEILAFVVSSVTLLGMFLLTVYGIYYPVYHFDDIKMNPVTHERHCLFFVDFKKQKVKQLLYFGFFMIRRMLFAFVIVCMKEDPKKQLVLCMFMFTWQLYYCVLEKPYVSQINNVLNVCNECILVLFTCLLYLFIETSDSNAITRIGWACIGVIIVFFLMNWFIIFPFLIYSGIKSCKGKKFNKEILDQGAPMTYNVLDPIRRGFQRPGFSIQEFRRRIQQSHPQTDEIRIVRAPDISNRVPLNTNPTLPEQLPHINSRLFS
ncbi:unnamed protein product [Moneuplotes crassus]|uniref:Uncharacterized protein n=1 Tax=Euplotes crassus TaxID=5936 RepID=A0AAD1Y174_EUPCR|nr:unnamed protein product [Moneuplotes crassus]